MVLGQTTPSVSHVCAHVCVFVCVQDLGVTKVGHMKRILQGIRELNRNSSASEA